MYVGMSKLWSKEEQNPAESDETKYQGKPDSEMEACDNDALHFSAGFCSDNDLKFECYRLLIALPLHRIE